jgi:hypothetical protein
LGKRQDVDPENEFLMTFLHPMTSYWEVLQQLAHDFLLCCNDFSNMQAHKYHFLMFAMFFSETSVSCKETTGILIHILLNGV